MASDEERWDALDAIAAAMDSRQGGLVPDVPTGARTWGEADGYWITMHKEPVLDALIALGWTSPAEVQQLREELKATVTTEYRDGIVLEAQRQIHELEGEVARYAALIGAMNDLAEELASSDDGQHPFEFGLSEAGAKMRLLLTSVDSGSALAEVKAQALEIEAERTETHYTIDRKNKRHPREVPVHNTRTRQLLAERAEQIRKEG